MKYYTILFLFLIPFFGCVTSNGREVNIVELKELGRTTKGNTVSLEIGIKNLSEESIFYWGYSISQPWYRIQTRNGMLWKEHEVGWFCGTGLEICELEPGQSAIIIVGIEENYFPIRVGVEYNNTGSGEFKEVAWSGTLKSNLQPVAGGDATR